jgi:histidinol-phosphate aminotransferase
VTSRQSSTIRIQRGPAIIDHYSRMDLLVNPYGPSIRVQEALASADGLYLPSDDRAAELMTRIADLLAVPDAWIVLGNGAEDLTRSILTSAASAGSTVVFPPTSGEGERIAKQLGREVVAVPRSPRFGVDLDLESCAKLPQRAVALVMSPNDPTGTCLSAQDAVRLSRSCDLVIVDERHGEYSGRTLLPLVREFDNLIVLRSFETWAGLSGFPIAFVVAPPKVASKIRWSSSEQEVAMGAVVAALATLDDLAYVRGTVARVREEKSRLYRTLRKLNMIRPLPSWANFILARIERGERNYFVRELARRDILVHRPLQLELDQFLRISATRAEETMALKQALIEAALPL